MKYIYSLIAFFIGTHSLDAQIVITKADLYSLVNVPVDHVEYSIGTIIGISDTIASLAAKTGIGQTWDLSQFTYAPRDEDISVYLTDMSQVPGSDYPGLSRANIVLKDHVTSNNYNDWTFEILSDTGLEVIGYARDTSGIILNEGIYNFPGPWKDKAFPLQYGTKWIGRITYFDQTSTYNNQWVTVNATITDSIYVDGEGTLLRPNLPPVSCLRLKHATIRKISSTLNSDYLYDTSFSFTFINGKDFKLGAFAPAHTSQDALVNQFFNSSIGASYTAPVTNAVKFNTPASLVLEQNIPNPCNHSTIIRYTLDEASPVKISVCDMLGRILFTSNEGIREAGSYTALFDASRYPSGSYLYTIEASGKKITKEMIILQ